MAKKELKKPKGKTALTFKNAAKEQLPQGTIQEWCDLANELGANAGWDLGLTPDKFEKKPKKDKASREDNGQPTLDDLFSVQDLAKDKGGVKKLREYVAGVSELAVKVGGHRKVDGLLERS